MLTLPNGIHAELLLKAIAKVESTYGQNTTPNHESAYDWGGRYADRTLLQAHGALAACSYGPWQVMFPNCVRVLPDVQPFDLLISPETGLLCAVLWIQDEIVGRQKAQTIEQIADAYNSGNFKDRFVPKEYIQKVVDHYNGV